ncbi:MAG: polysaccharide biosynthesis tyrosine autokinase [Candidatus Auribacterota bacterium]|jgi:capsular exopolysaccharide synthesis family protein|nr:polysaccharide biosynthesis tyrosine autokinase [Candidatus Auribacterota bacterium]
MQINMRDNMKELQFLDYWKIIMKRKDVVASAFFITIITVAIWTFVLQAPLYRASTKLLVEKERVDINIFNTQQRMDTYDPYYYQTQYEIIQGKEVLEEVIRDLDLQERLASRSGETLEMETAIKGLRRLIEVQQYRNTNLLEVIVFNQNRFLAADIANKIAEVYRTQRLSVRRRVVSDAVQKLREELEDMRNKLNESEIELEKLKREKDISIVRGINIDKQQLSDFNADYLRAKTERLEKEVRINELNKLSDDQKLHAIAVEKYYSNLATLKNTLAEAEIELSALSEEYKEKHPLILEAKSRVEEARQRLASEIQGIMNGLETEYTVAKTREETLLNVVNEAKETIKELDSKELEYIRLERDVETNRQMYMMLKQNLKEQDVVESLPITSVEIIERAVPPLEGLYSKPNKPLNIILGIVVGLLIGCALAFILEYFDISVKTINDVEQYLQLPILGVIPQKVGVLVNEGPFSANYEAYRVLRTNIEFYRQKSKTKTMMLTSGGVGEGKTTTLVNLSITMAHSGDKVLMIESDLRRPSIYRALEINPPATGIVDVIENKGNYLDVIQETAVPNLYYLPCGKGNVDLNSFFEIKNIRSMIKLLSERFDLIMFDSPPMMGISDSSILASEVDAVLLVLGYRKFPKEVAYRAVKAIETAEGKLIGAVLNEVNLKREDYFYYHHNYRYYQDRGYVEAPSRKKVSKKAASADEKDKEVKV